MKTQQKSKGTRSGNDRSPPFSVFLLSAGLGTRLRPLTSGLPKPLIPLVGRPLIAHILEQFDGISGLRVACNAHYLREMMERRVPEIAGGYGLSIDVLVEEPEILGTGGGVRNAISALGIRNTLLVVNGDIYHECDYAAFYKAHQKSGFPMTIGLRPMGGRHLTSFELRGDGRVVPLVEAADTGSRKSFFYTGVSLIEPELFERVPAQGCLYRNFMKALMEQGKVGGVLLHEGLWVDCGTPEDYFELSMRLLSAAGAKSDASGARSRAGGARSHVSGARSHVSGARSHVSGARGQIVAPVVIGDRTDIGQGACVGPRVVLGSDVTVGRNCMVRDAVVWDGIRLAENQTFEKAIVYGNNQLLKI